MEKIEIPVKVKPEPIDNTDLVNAFRADGGGILHVRPSVPFMGSKSARGVTIAYRLKGSRVEFATAVQHGSDDFTKKIGTKTAIEHFRAGKAITMPTRRVKRTTDLHYLLRQMVYSMR